MCVIPSPCTGAFYPKEGSAEESEAHALTVVQYAACAGLRSHPFPCCDHSRSSAGLWCVVGRARALAQLRVTVCWLQGLEQLLCCQKFGLYLWYCQCKCQQQLLLPLMDHSPGPSAICVSLDQIRFWDQVALDPVSSHGVSGAAVFAQIGLGSEARRQLLV